MEPGELINIHAVIPCSRVNGPGRRMVVFFQGCNRSCPGCFNAGTHSFEPRHLYGAGEVFERFFDPSVEGITVSGGEPFAQAEGLLNLLNAAVERGLTTVVYTGFMMEELAEDPAARAALGLIDVLVDGPFEADKTEPTLLARGSSNQRFHFLTRRYGISDFHMPGKLEVVIGKDGDVIETGFSRLTFR
ncbi:MAG: radical SAM protein [Deltaproteobacteria bacterium]|nr:radical SAM protein [Deltaproteobacteria bacterium]